MSHRIASSLAALVAVGSVLVAQTPKDAAAPALKVGMPAPALKIEKWVKGSAVPSFEKGKVYVVEFWATWCGPCIGSMPHLTEMQHEFKDKGVTIVGVTSKDTRGNSLERVEKMVADKGDGMGYTVAWDSERATNEAFMTASGQGGIPCSFLVDKTGTLAYIGHPMFLDEPLAEVVAGTWDIEKGNARIAETEKDLDGVYEALGNALGEDGKKKDAEDALAKIDAFAAKHAKLAKQFSGVRFPLTLKTGDYDAAYKLAAKIVDDAIAAKEVDGLAQVAWTIVNPDAKLERVDLDLALRAAQKADEISGGKEAELLDLLARVYAAKGDFKKAVEIETKAVGLAEGPYKPMLQKTLDEYTAKSK